MYDLHFQRILDVGPGLLIRLLLRLRLSGAAPTHL